MTGNQLLVYNWYKGTSRLNRNQLFRPPENLSIDKDLTIGLSNRRTFIFGELTEQKFYATYNEADNSFSDLVYDVKTEYQRDSDNYYAQIITNTVTWYDIEGQATDPIERVPIRLADESDQYDEIVTRRQNIINKNLVPIAKQAGIRNRMLELFKNYNDVKMEYVNSGTATFYNAIATDTSTWLDQVVLTVKPRSLILTYLAYGIDPLEKFLLVDPIDTLV